MIDIRKFIDIVNEEWNNDQLFEMANLTQRSHGIEGVVIWVGMSPKQHGLRVKVSNAQGKMNMDDSVIVMMPSLDYDPTTVAPWLKKMMPKVLEWIKLNQQPLYDYENGIIQDTGEFLEMLVKVC